MGKIESENSEQKRNNIFKLEFYIYFKGSDSVCLCYTLHSKPLSFCYKHLNKHKHARFQFHWVRPGCRVMQAMKHTNPQTRTAIMPISSRSQIHSSHSYTHIHNTYRLNAVRDSPQKPKEIIISCQIQCESDFNCLLLLQLLLLYMPNEAGYNWDKFNIKHIHIRHVYCGARSPCGSNKTTATEKYTFRTPTYNLHRFVVVDCKTCCAWNGSWIGRPCTRAFKSAECERCEKANGNVWAPTPSCVACCDGREEWWPDLTFRKCK